MKNINVKKVVAGAAALALGVGVLGVAIAGNNNGTTFGTVAQSDVYTTSSMTPKVSIVTGTIGDDDAWAQNIANAIASNAKRENPLYASWVPSDGEPSSEMDSGLLTDDIDIITEGGPIDEISLEENDYPVLHDEDITGKITGDKSFEIRERESLTVNGTAGFISNETDKKAESLMLLMDKGDVVYVADFSADDGIPFDNGTNTTYFDTGDRLSLWFMGKKYNVQSIDTDGEKITLVETGATNTYTTGDSIDVTGTDGTNYTIVVGNAFNDGEKIQLTLKNGSTTLQSTTFEVTDEVEFDGYDLENSVTVTDIADDSSTANNDMVELSVGQGSTLELEHGKALPGYKDGSNQLWTVTITNDGNYITDISVANDYQRWNKTDLTKTNKGLVPGDKAELPLGLGVVNFLGLTEEKLYTFQVGDESVKWQDTKGRDHEAFFYEEDVADSVVTVDGQDYYIELTAGGNIAIHDGPNSDDSDITAEVGLADQKSGTFTFDGSTGADAIPYYLEVSVNKIFMGLDETAEFDIGKGANATWTFEGTYDSNMANPEGYYDGDATSSSNTFAVFQVEEATGTVDTLFYIDPYTGDLAQQDDYEDADAYEAQADYDTGAWLLDQDEAADDMASGYTEFGSLVEVDGGIGMFTVPDAVRFLQVFVGGVVTTTTGGTEENPYDEFIYTDVDTETLLKKDSMAATGTLIVVGGHLANTVADGITNTFLAQTGDYIVGKHSNGNIYVAGWTKADTGTAAGELVTTINGW